MNRIRYYVKRIPIISYPYYFFRYLLNNSIPNYKLSKVKQKGSNSVLLSSNFLNPNRIVLGDYVIVNSSNHFITNNKNIIIKKYTSVSSDCIIVSHNHIPTVGIPQSISNSEHINDVENEVIIEEDVWIGAGSILLHKCHIGRGAVIGAGSVITKPVPPYAVVVGNPQRIIASKFSLEQILKHETSLYPPEERMTVEELKELFENYYSGMPSIGVDSYPEEDYQTLLKVRKEMGVADYSEV